MKVLAVVGARKGGNTDALVNAFIQSAVKEGQQAEIEYLFEKKSIHGCNGCYICRKTGSGTCTIRDDLTPVLIKAAEADVIVLASPVYFYNVSAQLKMFMDRTYAMTDTGREKRIFFISTAVGPSEYMEEHLQNAEKAVEEYVMCMKGWQLERKINCWDMYIVRDIKQTKAYQEAVLYGTFL